jgi:peptidoglycan hydrolase CwlO-like protein
METLVMLDFVTDRLVEVLGGLALAILVAFIGIQKIIKDWRSTSAETTIITLMQSELERLNQQNTTLSVEIGRLHNEIITLNKELQNLALENQRLQAEVIALTNEVSSLRKLAGKDSNGKIKIN